MILIWGNMVRQISLSAPWYRAFLELLRKMNFLEVKAMMQLGISYLCHE